MSSCWVSWQVGYRPESWQVSPGVTILLLRTETHWTRDSGHWNTAGPHWHVMWDHSASCIHFIYITQGGKLWLKAIPSWQGTFQSMTEILTIVHVSEDGADSADAGPLRQGAPGPQPRSPAWDGGDRVQRWWRQDASHRAHLQREVGRHGEVISESGVV